jgi:serine phosphatase RsbU (regulator of sigma subunit)
VGTKLTVATVALVAVAVGGSAFYSLRSIDDLSTADAETRRRDGKQAIESRTVLLVQNIALSSTGLLAGGETTVLESQAKRTLAANQDIEWLVISDHNGRVVYASPRAPTEQSKPVDPRDPMVRQLARAPTSTKVVKLPAPDDQRQLTFGVNLVTRGDAGALTFAGQLRLRLSTAKFEKALAASLAEARAKARSSARKQLVFAGILLVLGMLFGWWQGMRITRPLRALDRSTTAIASGEFDRRVEVTSGDELGHLAESFNTMAESLGRLVKEMAAKASLERELELARSVQELMSPPSDLVEIGPFALAGVCELAESCGGDWWTYRVLSDGRLLIVVGDVTGHGMPAAMIAATARGAVEALALGQESELTPPKVLAAIDRAIRDVGREQLLMTSFAVLLDPGRRVVDFANAGHCFPYLIRAEPSGRFGGLGVLAVRGNPLGSSNQCIRGGSRPWHPGDVVILTTDGMVDRVDSDGERFGEKRFRRLLIAHERDEDLGDAALLRDRIVEAVEDFGGDEPADDDMTLVVCSYRAVASEQALADDVPGDAEASSDDVREVG